jgi:phosphohistidine phosphatase
MVLYLVHHGEAVPPDVDPQRPLSDRGRALAEQLARDAATRGVKPAAIWHSGKLRARQTAESFRSRCNPLAEFAAATGLQPTDPPTVVRDQLAGETRDVMLVGHLPHLTRLLALLLTGDADGSVDFPTNGMVALERTPDGWRERWRLAPG